METDTPTPVESETKETTANTKTFNLEGFFFVFFCIDRLKYYVKSRTHKINMVYVIQIIKDIGREYEN